MVAELFSTVRGFVVDAEELAAVEDIIHRPAFAKYALSKHFSKHDSLA